MGLANSASAFSVSKPQSEKQSHSCRAPWAVERTVALGVGISSFSVTMRQRVSPDRMLEYHFEARWLACSCAAVFFFGCFGSGGSSPESESSISSRASAGVAIDSGM